jgi:hypothetical protein
MNNIYKNSTVGNLLLCFGVAAFFFFVFCAWYIWQHHLDKDRISSLILAAVWVVGSPAWFFFEHMVLFRKYGDPTQYEQFTRAQDLAAKIWAGSILVLAPVWIGGFPK